MLGYQRSAWITPSDFGTQDIALFHRAFLGTFQGRHARGQRHVVELVVAFVFVSPAVLLTFLAPAFAVTAVVVLLAAAVVLREERAMR